MPRKIKHYLEQEHFTDGLATFYSVTDVAAPGDLPRYEITPLFQAPFSERKISDSRFFDAQQYGVTISRQIRCPLVEGLQPSGDVCMLTGYERQFVIKKVAPSRSSVPPTMDLTLEDTDLTYEIRGDINDNA